MAYSKKLTGLAAALACSILAGAALASGGGGGGGGGGSMGGGSMGSSGPSYNPVEEYKNGIAALKAEKYKDAIRYFGHVLEVAPKDANTWTLMGLSKEGNGDLKGARSAYEKAVRFDDKSVTAHRQLGVVNAKLGDTGKAQAELDLLKKRSDECMQTCAQAADLTAAIASVQAAMAPGGGGSTPPHASLLFDSRSGGDHAYVAAVALINEGRYDDALASLRASEQAIGPHPDILTYMGYANRKLKRYDMAETYYRQALSVDPNHRGATEYYGELKVERGDLAGAEKLLTRLDQICGFGCTEAEELRGWIDRARSHGS